MTEAQPNIHHTAAMGNRSAGHVPAGYKRTEAGVIPQDWEACTIGAVAEIGNGGTPNTGNANYWNGNVPWCVPTDVTGTPGKYLSVTERRISAAGLANSSASMLPAGALLLCSRATIGDVRIATVPICVNQGFKPLVCKNGIDNEFLYYVVLTQKSRMLERASGSTFQEIGKSALSAIPLPIPPLAEQRAIAEALSDVDSLLESLDALMPTSDVTPNGLATASCILRPNTIIGADILVIRASADGINGIFLAYTIKAHRNQVMQLVSGTTVFHLSDRDMANFQFSSPSLYEQYAIVVILTEIDDEIVVLEQRRDKTRAIKQGMMQQLLTGQVRLI